MEVNNKATEQFETLVRGKLQEWSVRGNSKALLVSSKDTFVLTGAIGLTDPLFFPSQGSQSTIVCPKFKMTYLSKIQYANPVKILTRILLGGGYDIITTIGFSQIEKINFFYDDTELEHWTLSNASDNYIWQFPIAVALEIT